MADEKNTAPQVDFDTEPAFVERKRILFFGLPWTFTKYTITPGFLTVSQGLLNTTEDDCYMYKIQDVKLNTSLMERILGLATVICYTGDVTHPELKMVHIKNAEAIKDFIMQASEQARIKRRTLHTMDINGNYDEEHESSIEDLQYYYSRPYSRKKENKRLTNRQNYVLIGQYAAQRGLSSVSDTEAGE